VVDVSATAVVFWNVFEPDRGSWWIL